MTIGDFSGLGRFSPFEHDRRKVSCILQNTEKGGNLLTEMVLSNRLSLHERPFCEAFDVEKQLKSPSVKHSGRERFEHEYRKNKLYEHASDVALRREKVIAIKTALMLRAKTLVYNFLVLIHLKHKQ